MSKNFIACIQEGDITWVYEGEVQGQPIWIKKEGARPMLMSEEEALRIAERDVCGNETPMIEKIVIRA